MDNEPEVTLQDMEDTRGALSEKLETLGQQVADSVQGATTAVADTVDNVTDAVQETVATVRETFDIPLQVQRHPWGMMGGAMALGCLGGYLLFRPRSEQPRWNGRREVTSRDSPGPNTQEDGVAKVHRLAEEWRGNEPALERAPGGSNNGWLNSVNKRFGPEMTKVKGLAIGAVLSAFRDLILPSLPEHLKPALGGVMDSITVKLGGEPVAQDTRLNR
jgi:ElaB/YqjD/DUF883 family membrane-anchored ribosome-binding protein